MDDIVPDRTKSGQTPRASTNLRHTRVVNGDAEMDAMGQDPNEQRPKQKDVTEPEAQTGRAAIPRSENEKQRRGGRLLGDPGRTQNAKQKLWDRDWGGVNRMKGNPEANSPDTHGVRVHDGRTINLLKLFCNRAGFPCTCTTSIWGGPKDTDLWRQN